MQIKRGRPASPNALDAPIPRTHWIHSPNALMQIKRGRPASPNALDAPIPRKHWIHRFPERTDANNEQKMRKVAWFKIQD